MMLQLVTCEFYGTLPVLQLKQRQLKQFQREKIKEDKSQMKVFIPMSDQIVDDNGVLSGDIVPFKTEFLSSDLGVHTSERPANWIIDCDYASACRRLFGQSLQREMSLG